MQKCICTQTWSPDHVNTTSIAYMEQDYLEFTRIIIKSFFVQCKQKNLGISIYTVTSPHLNREECDIDLYTFFSLSHAY